MDSRHYPFGGKRPTVDDTAHVSRESTLVGDVRVGAHASVWPGVVLRGDVGPVVVGRESHVGDNATLHASTLGERVMVGHGAVLNESTVDDGALVGFNAAVSEATVGADSIVAMGTVVLPGTEIPPGSFAFGTPASYVPLSESGVDPEAVFEDYSSGGYADLADRHTELFD
ncbi:gamma carbonic anhydrase family protein [Halomarina salina]|uniref:Gamma carbonic anhydrase family protein n=1 Tax=Halomarina salina TaxID=1872699 RepID=A0ABD5RNW9_9EURY|nr:gamma carbonic anhydrase family protein [Halomarina salina]